MRTSEKRRKRFFISADRHRSYKIIRERNQPQAVSAEWLENTIDGGRKSIRAVCHEALEDYENSMAELHRVRQGYSHTLTLAVSPLIADTVLPSVMKRYTEDNKETEMTVTIFESEEIASQIRNGSADIGLSRLKVQSSSSLAAPVQ